MKKLILLFLLPLGALAQNPTMPGVGLVFGSNNPGGGGGSGPYSPSSFTANAVLLGNGTGAIQSSGITSTAGGSGFTAAASTDLTLNAGSGTGNKVVVVNSPYTATSGTFQAFSVTPTYNQVSGTAANTDLLVNRTQTAVGSGTQRLLDLQVGSATQLNVDTSGNVVAQGNVTAGQFIGIGGNTVYLKTTGTNPVILQTNSLTALTLSSSQNATFAGSVLSSSASGGVGYGAGAGAAVTQATNRSTGVTINATTGQITGNGASLAALASATFTVTNSAVALHDVIVLSVQSGPTNPTTKFDVSTVAAGSFNITIYNSNVTTADTGAPIINFAVIKGSSS